MFCIFTNYCIDQSKSIHKILEDAGLITYSREGLWVNYRLAGGDRNPYVASLLGNLRHWLEEDPEVEALVARLPEIRREIICGG